MTGTYIGRIWNPAQQDPSVVALRDGLLHDITTRMAPTVREICAMEDPAGHVAAADGDVAAPLADLVQASVGNLSVPHLLAPCDLQPVRPRGRFQETCGGIETTRQPVF